MNKLKSNLNDLETKSEKSITILKSLLENLLKEIKALQDKVQDLDESKGLTREKDIEYLNYWAGHYPSLLHAFSYSTWPEWIYNYYYYGWSWAYPYVSYPNGLFVGYSRSYFFDSWLTYYP